ncbi:hypothetical protein DIPPA_34603 [Diplonema papillatum]|nr:hypothetical protein DIPPA_34603 [Diplonema papillatum]|eukprot:gene17721-27272_t
MEYIESSWASAFLAYATVFTFLVYGYDKFQARRGGGRVSEFFLHVCMLLGGTAGAVAAMAAFNHKWRKARFMAVFTLLLSAQLAAIRYALHYG